MYCSFVSLNSRVVYKTSGLSVVGCSSEDTPSRNDEINLVCVSVDVSLPIPGGYHSHSICLIYNVSTTENHLINPSLCS